VRKLEVILKGRESLNGKEREERVVELTKLLDSALGGIAPIAGDPIIQVGTVCIRGSSVERHIFVLGTCDPVEGAVVHSVKTEKDLLLKWFEWVQEKNFDVFCGYNIFGFDERYLWERLEELGLEQEESVQRLTRLFDEGGQVKLEMNMLSSSALGDNQLYMWTTPGRLRIDLYGHIKRKSQMPSYKLDAVAAAFLSGKLSTVVPHGENKWLLKTKQKGDARVGRYVQILDELGEDLTEKASIIDITADGLVVESEEDYRAIAGEAARWAIVKDDVPPQELFRLHREGGSAGRARIASYCIQDCDLVYELYKKLDVFNEAMSMANVCSVPVRYIFVRGQGIKIESLIFKDCMAKNQLIEVKAQYHYGKKSDYNLQDEIRKLKKLEETLETNDDGERRYCQWQRGAEKSKVEKQTRLVDWLMDESTKEDSYEGAIVLDPEPGFYTDSPVGVCDFASLYPSTIISENISHDMLVWVKDYDLNGKLLAVIEGSDEDEKFAPPGTRWTDIEFDIWRPDPSDTRKHPVKLRAGTRICRYAQSPTGQGSLPQIVAKLLAARKAKRAEIPKTDDPFKKALLDAEQNAYKITANSLYGQLGSRTFKIRLQHLAASVTAYGRKQILFSKAAIEKFYGPTAGRPDCSAKIVYGDTDSIFVAFHPKGPDGTPLEGREAIVKTIELTEEAGKFITGALRAPHDFEYDKIFYPFIIFSKKRYVGNKYEENPDEFKETSMGIVLKRRDNAPLLKMTYGAAIDALLNRRDVAEATEAVKAQVKELVEGKMKLSQLTITKSLRAEYMGSPPAHKVLADRIKARDPGNAPASGERIGFVYIKPPTGQEASRLQGDRVETPQFIVENKLQPDAEYYIDHQLTNPLSQLFGLLLEKMPGYQPPSKWNADPEKRITERELLAADLLFREGLQACRQQATRAFLAKMGGTTTASAGSATSRRAVRSPPSAPLPEAVVKKQITLAAFLKDTSGFNDQLLAREMRTAKRKAKQNDK
jgi:DNA polymerase elongation subunit (family B)